MVRCCASKSDSVRSCMSLISCSESLSPCAAPDAEDGCNDVEAGGMEADASALAAGLAEKDEGGGFSVVGVEVGFAGDEAFVGEGCVLGSALVDEASGPLLISY